MLVTGLIKKKTKFHIPEGENFHHSATQNFATLTILYVRSIYFFPDFLVAFIFLLWKIWRSLFYPCTLKFHQNIYKLWVSFHLFCLMFFFWIWSLFLDCLILKKLCQAFIHYLALTTLCMHLQFFRMTLGCFSSVRL